MSAPSPGQLRPNSAIYIGAGAEQEGTPPLQTTTTSNESFRSPGAGRQTPHLPSPPHTSSTSGSAGEFEGNSHNSSTRTKRATIALPTVTVMHNGAQDDIFDDHVRNEEHDNEDRTERILPRPSLADKNREVNKSLLNIFIFNCLLTMKFLAAAAPLAWIKSHDASPNRPS